MKKKVLLLLPLLLLMLLLGSCQKALDTSENRKVFSEDTMLTYTFQSWGTLYAGIETPWIAVREEKTEDQGVGYRILGVSEELSKEKFSHDLLRQVNTLVICRVNETTAEYRYDSGVISKGTTEVAEIKYYRVDREAKELILYAGWDEVSNALPEKSTGTPHLTVSEKQITNAVEERAASRVSPIHPTNYFLVSKEGELNQHFVLGRHVTIVIPDNVKRIARMSFGNGTDDITVWVPASVEEIADHTFQDYKKTFTLVVESGSYAEQYAMENDISYEYTEEYEQ